MKDINGRLTRWSLALQPYHFTVTHRSGTSHDNADSLLRQAWDEMTWSLQEKEGGVSGSSYPAATTGQQSSLTS